MKKTLQLLLLTVWTLTAIASSAAAFNTLEGFYIFAGICNLLFNGVCIFKTGKKALIEDEE